MSWAVLMPTEGPQRGALAGDYVGASGQVAVGVGVGGNVLVGGSNRSVTLQPFSVEGTPALTSRSACPAWCCVPRNKRVCSGLNRVERGGNGSVHRGLGL